MYMYTGFPYIYRFLGVYVESHIQNEKESTYNGYTSNGRKRFLVSFGSSASCISPFLDVSSMMFYTGKSMVAFWCN